MTRPPWHRPDRHAARERRGARRRSGPARRRLGALWPVAFSTANRFCRVLLCGRAGRSTAQNGGFPARAVVAAVQAIEKEAAETARIGLGRIVALHHRASASCRVHAEVGWRSVPEATMRPNPQARIERADALANNARLKGGRADLCAAAGGGVVSTRPPVCFVWRIANEICRGARKLLHGPRCRPGRARGREGAAGGGAT